MIRPVQTPFQVSGTPTLMKVHNFRWGGEIIKSPKMEVRRTKDWRHNHYHNISDVCESFSYLCSSNILLPFSPPPEERDDSQQWTWRRMFMCSNPTSLFSLTPGFLFITLASPCLRIRTVISNCSFISLPSARTNPFRLHVLFVRELRFKGLTQLNHFFPPFSSTQARSKIAVYEVKPLEHCWTGCLAVVYMTEVFVLHRDWWVKATPSSCFLLS